MACGFYAGSLRNMLNKRETEAFTFYPYFVRGNFDIHVQ